MAGPSFDSKYVLIHWEAGVDALTLQWKRPAQYQSFKDGLEAGIREAERHKAERLIADNSLLKLQDEDEAFFLKQWVPKLAKAGVSRLAVVVERRQFVQIPKTRLQQRLKSGALVLHYFDDMDEAKIWVKTAKAA